MSASELNLISAEPATSQLQVWCSSWHTTARAMASVQLLKINLSALTTAQSALNARHTYNGVNCTWQQR